MGGQEKVHAARARQIYDEQVARERLRQERQQRLSSISSEIREMVPLVTVPTVVQAPPNTARVSPTSLVSMGHHLSIACQKVETPTTAQILNRVETPAGTYLLLRDLGWIRQDQAESTGIPVRHPSRTDEMAPWTAYQPFVSAAKKTHHTIYALLDPRTERVAYIGKTGCSLEARLSNHLTRPTSRVMARWLESLPERPLIRPLAHVPRHLLNQAEIGWILWGRRQGQLLNIDPGGNHRLKNGKVNVRNQWLVHAISALVKQGMPPNVIAFVTLEPPAREKQSSLEKECARLRGKARRRKGRLSRKERRRLHEVQERLRSLNHPGKTAAQTEGAGGHSSGRPSHRTTGIGHDPSAVTIPSDRVVSGTESPSGSTGTRPKASSEAGAPTPAGMPASGPRPGPLSTSTG